MTVFSAAVHFLKTAAVKQTLSVFITVTLTLIFTWLKNLTDKQDDSFFQNQLEKTKLTHQSQDSCTSNLSFRSYNQK